MRVRPSRNLAFGALALACALAPSVRAEALRTLRVCADPANFPYSNRERAGFENAIVEVVAQALEARSGLNRRANSGKLTHFVSRFRNRFSSIL